MKQLPRFTRRQWAGLVCIYLAGVGWLIDILTPFLPIRNKHVVFASALGFAELMFLVGVALLGRATYRQLRVKLLDAMKKRNDQP
jgi:hypothetical protein